MEAQLLILRTAGFHLFLKMFRDLFFRHLFFDLFTILFIDSRSLHSFDLNMLRLRKSMYLQLESHYPIGTDDNFLDYICQKLIELFRTLEIFLKKVILSNESQINVCLIDL